MILYIINQVSLDNTSVSTGLVSRHEGHGQIRINARNGGLEDFVAEFTGFVYRNELNRPNEFSAGFSTKALVPRIGTADA